MNLIVHLLLLAALSGLAGAAWVAQRPADLGGIRQAAPDDTRRPRDVLDDLKQAAIKRSAVFEITEADLNHHLARVLQAGTLPPLNRWAAFARAAAALQPGQLEVTLVWEVLGSPRTATFRFHIQRLEGSFRVVLTGGSYGRLRVPRGLLRPMLPALEQLGLALEQEIQALFQMNQIQISEHKLVIDPRFP
ncbi:MAG TPA: hypothetical protein DIT64_10315 [Verrucomicrobiales bacterium]|nr:hypothetical protein [Verrucomicrobiales bacterium]HRJ08429.1 hypothetical protein [Prosthecobacter sp.]